MSSVPSNIADYYGPHWGWISTQCDSAVAAAAAVSMPSIQTVFEMLKSSFGASAPPQSAAATDDVIQKRLCATSLLQQALMLLSRKIDYEPAAVIKTGFEKLESHIPSVPTPLPSELLSNTSVHSCSGLDSNSQSPLSFKANAIDNSSLMDAAKLEWFPFLSPTPVSLPPATLPPMATSSFFPFPSKEETDALPIGPLPPLVVPTQSTGSDQPAKKLGYNRFTIPHLLGDDVEDNEENNGSNSKSHSRFSRPLHCFECGHCSRSYATRTGLMRHQKQCSHLASRSSDDIVECFDHPLDMTIVEASPSKSELDASPSARLDRQYTCHICTKIYFSMSALKMHIRTHTLPCKCTVCGKAFSRMWLLNGHLRTHTGEKPFGCRVCQRAFADRSNLRAHMQTHSEVKKYRCEECGKTFSRMGLLSKHRVSACSSGSQPGGGLLGAEKVSHSTSSSAEENEFIESPSQMDLDMQPPAFIDRADVNCFWPAPPPPSVYS